MSRSTVSSSTQQLAEFVAVVSTAADEQIAMRSAAELVAQSLGADAVAVVSPGGVAHCVGWPAGAAPLEAIRTAAAAEPGVTGLLAVPGLGELPVSSVNAGEIDDVRLLLIRAAGPLDAEEKGLLRGMERTLGLAVRNHEALGVLRERQRLLEGLSEIQRSIAHRAPLHQVFDAIVQLGSDILGEHQTVLLLRDKSDPDTLGIAASTGIPEALFIRMRRTSVQDGIAGRAIREDRLVVVDDYGKDPTNPRGFLDVGVTACMAAPVHEDGAVVGAISVSSYRPGRSYSRADQTMLSTLAQYASLALNDARIVSTMVHQALHDPLTAMPNRALFDDRLSHALQRADRNDSQVAVLFIDLDRFKPVNDSLGHAAGDDLLKAVGARIADCLREGDTAGRLGGDEFAVLLEDRPSSSDAVDIARRLIDTLAAPFVLKGREVFVGASVGIAIGRRGADDLLRKADVAMYRAKAEGRGRYALYESSMQAEVIERLELEADLRHALQRGEFELFYQPIVHLMSGALHGVEALIRWRHPTRGLVGPADFIAVAEETGLIIDLGRWVIDQACHQLAEWQAAGAPDDLTMNVNVSGRQLDDPELANTVAAAVNGLGLGESRLVLEITETVLMRDTNATVTQLRELRSLGVLLAVDDFGTGYSSLRYLSSFPVDLLKMARPFVEQIEGGSDLRALAQTIADLGTNLGLRVIAEGIETPGQFAELRALGCELGQGFHFGPPIRADEITPMILAAVSQRGGVL